MGTNITGINPPQRGDTSYIQKIIDSFTAVDNHDHSSGKGLPIARIADNSVTTASIAANAVTTAKIPNGAITIPKLTSVGQQISNSSGYFFTGSSNVLVTNLAVNITTNGNPVFIGIISDGSSDSSWIGVENSFSNATTTIVIKRNSVSLYSYILGTNAQDNFFNLRNVRIPGSSIWTIDEVAAGTYTYAVYVYNTTDTGTYFYNSKLIAYEIK